MTGDRARPGPRGSRRRRRLLTSTSPSAVPATFAAVKASAAFVAIGLALAAAGCFGDDDDEQAAQGRAPLKLVDDTVVEGGPRRERGLLVRTVGGMEKTALTRIRIGPLQGRREGDAGAAVPIAFTPVQGASVRRQWDEWIVAGGFSRRLRAAGLPAEVDGADAEGGFTARPRLRGQPDPQPLSRREEQALVRAIRRAAQRSGGDVVRLEVHKPYGAAVALSVATKEPARFLKSKLRGLLENLERHRQRLEGLYLGVLDDRGLLALEWASWTRNPAGSYWVRHDLANCSPIEQSAPPGTDPPPDCPA
jgi:hypothetical protein